MVRDGNAPPTSRGHRRHDGGMTQSAATVAEDQSHRRWATLLAVVVDIATAGRHRIVVDGLDHVPWFAARLAMALREAGHRCTRLTGDSAGTAPPRMVVADGSSWLAAPPAGGWDLVIWLRTTRY